MSEKWVPSPDQIAKIEELAGEGASQVRIAATLGISRTTYRKNLADETGDNPVTCAIERGRGKTAKEVFTAALEMATSGKCWPATESFLEVLRLGSHG